MSAHLNHTSTGRGRLGLEGGHREVADLIRRSELLSARGDEEALQRTAQRVVQVLADHIEAERSLLVRVEAGRRGLVRAGQAALLERATRFAAHPEPDAGADLLALLVRQADVEEAVFHTGGDGPDDRPAGAVQSSFTTDWALAPVLVGSP